MINEWDFDDGYSGKRASIKHQYLESGSYNVKLTVTNDKGATNMVSIKVVINKDQVKGETMLAPYPKNVTIPLESNLKPASASTGVQSSGVFLPNNSGRISQIIQIDLDNGFPANQVAWSPDGRLLAVASAGISLYDAHTWSRESLIGTEGWINSISFSPDSRTLASAGMSSGAKLWDVASGGEKRAFEGISEELCSNLP